MRADVLVTGGSGFIGGHLVERLIADGARVRVLDRRAPSTLPGVDWIEADIRDERAVARASKGASTVFHLASVVGVDALLADPVEAVDVAVSGTLRVLDAAAAERIPVVHFSTSEVLGVNPQVPWAEDADRVLGSSLSDRWSYGTAKATAEHLVLGWSRGRSIPATIVRPFNVYGPRQEPRFVVAAMVEAAVRGQVLHVDGDGHQTRCFTYVDDLVDGVVRIAAEPGRVPLVHLGSSDERTIAALAVLVAELAGSDLPPEHRDHCDRWGALVPDIARRIPDTSLALAAFGWRATTSLEDGVGRVVEWARTSISENERLSVT